MRRGDCSCPVEERWDLTPAEYARHHLEVHSAYFPDTPELYGDALQMAIRYAEAAEQETT
jgi:hypothetical protein